MKLLVTGANGFVGRHLLQELMENGHEAVALVRHEGNADLQCVSVYEADILNFSAVSECIRKERPDGIIHLAAQSNVALSWDRAALTVDVNVGGALNLMKAVVESGLKIKLLNVGSGDEYGITAKKEMLLREDMACLPQNPYSISKLCAEQMLLQLGKKHDIAVVQARSFNHFGPGQRKGFVVSDFASQIAEIEKGMILPIVRVGDLDTCRDFTFVKDIVRAYRLLMEADIRGGIYNVCSGKATRIRDMLDMLIAMASKDINVERNEKIFRAAEVRSFAGSAEKLKRDTGWHTVFGVQAALLETLNWWRNI